MLLLTIKKLNIYHVDADRIQRGVKDGLDS